MLSVDERRKAVVHPRQKFNASERRACRIVGISLSVYRYQAKTQYDKEISDLLRILLTQNHPDYGFAKRFHLIRNLGHRWNPKRIHSIYCALRLNLRKKRKKQIPNRPPQPLTVPLNQNICWSMDFMSDALSNGKRFRTFNVIDDYHREILTIEIDLSCPTQRIIRVLDRFIEYRGCPQRIRMDNGPEFISVNLATWTEKRNICLTYIHPTRQTHAKRLYRTEPIIQK